MFVFFLQSIQFIVNFLQMMILINKSFKFILKRLFLHIKNIKLMSPSFQFILQMFNFILVVLDFLFKFSLFINLLFFQISNFKLKLLNCSFKTRIFYFFFLVKSNVFFNFKVLFFYKLLHVLILGYLIPLFE